MITTFKCPTNISKKTGSQASFLWLNKLFMQINRHPLEIIRSFAEQSLAMEIYCSYNGGNKNKGAIYHELLTKTYFKRWYCY
ncbi:hypothetical protein NUITMVRA1_12730 [Aerococcus viridans]|nr:hypothetical protein NUITMVRA1_12730 [Aerococcus viridans]